MFRRRTSRTALYERLLEEKNQQLAVLASEVDWLRAQLGRPTIPNVYSPTVDLVAGHGLVDGEPAAVTDGDWVDEFAEAQKIIEENGLSSIHLDEILDGLGLGSSDLA